MAAEQAIYDPDYAIVSSEVVPPNDVGDGLHTVYRLEVKSYTNTKYVKATKIAVFSWMKEAVEYCSVNRGRAL